MSDAALDKAAMFQAQFSEAQRLGQDGKFRCRAGCNQIFENQYGIQICHDKAVAMTICFPCLNRYEVILSRGPTGVDIKLRERSIVIVGGR